MTEITVHVKLSNAGNFPVQVEVTTTVLGLKQKLVEQSSISTEQQRLIYKGRVLKDESTLASYGIEDNQNLYLVRGSAPTTRSPAVASDSPTTYAAGGTPAAEGAPGTGGPPGLGGLGGLGGSEGFG
eukprot:CAMPEP_0198213460 /NCGR_PEP_ID=MMETSP1445-20131203/28882_1 /TAXON_ID=36898 /ORGANISM="Pyramimonas sp., Strain CCMP2087" /LENGTH=126 /DNA_ID=CAMNT_0043888111 /DNA_START=170 /DNA_END=546 /DNA_ORIENTATION=+